MVLVAAALSALLALDAPVSASPASRAPLDLSWVATPPCSSRSEVEVEVARLLSLADGVQRQVLASASLGENEQGAVLVDLRLEIAGVSYRRAFQAESCQAAKSAVALILAIAINPAAAKAASNAAEPAASSSGPDAAPAKPSPPPPAPSRESKAPPSMASAPPSAPRASSSLWAGLAGVADIGTLPKPSPGAELALGYRRGRVRVEGALSLFLAQRASDPTSPVLATFHALSGELRLAYGSRLGRFWLGPQACVGLTRIQAGGDRGSVANFDRSVLVPHVGGGGVLVWAVASRVELRAALEGLVPTFRPKFVVDEPPPAPPEVVHQSPAVVGRAMIGASIQFL